MTAQVTKKILARILRHLVRVALIALFLIQLTRGVHGAENAAENVAVEAADPFDTLYNVIMTR